MASVWRCEQDVEPREVALKIMRPEFARHEDFAHRFYREATTIRRISHPNIVRIFDVGADGEMLYIAMELLRGQDLFDIRVREGRLSERHAATILLQVTDALACAHDKGVLHRDIKPENVMLLRDGSHHGIELVKVLDFGLAKIFDRERFDVGDVPLTSPSSDALPVPKTLPLPTPPATSTLPLPSSVAV